MSEPMTSADAERYEVAKVIYEARLKAAWGAAWQTRQAFPDFADPTVARAYPHNPVADVDLALFAAAAVLERWVMTDPDRPPTLAQLRRSYRGLLKISEVLAEDCYGYLLNNCTQEHAEGLLADAWEIGKEDGA